MKNKFGNYTIFSILFLTLFTPFVLFLEWAHTPVGNNQEVVHYIAAGSSVSIVANDLSAQHVLTHPRLFKLYARLLRAEKNIKSGTFVFTGKNSPADILNKLISGDSLKVKVVIPEGLNIYQIAQKLSETFPTYPTVHWVGLMSDPSLIAQLPIQNTQIKTIEGFLFPDTYFFDPSETPMHVLQTFISHFKQVVTPDMYAKAKTLGLNPLEYITLASIVQKESAINTELNEISRVFLNRLKLGMKLQSDPTVIYGAWNAYNGKITKKHLRTKTNYNTYIQYGLPIAPIANPGLLSLVAVLNPTQSNNLYFVAVGDGTHAFSESYKNHQQAVKRYIKHLRIYAR